MPTKTKEEGRTITFKPTRRQFQAWEKLTDQVTTEIGFGGGSGGGKRLSEYTKVFTDSGWKHAKDVTKEDRLVSVDGSYTRIKGIFKANNRPTFRIIFSDGQTVDCDDEHNWYVYSANHGKRDGWKVKTTKQLLQNPTNWSVPLLENAIPGKEWLGADPYIIGYILGNGTLTGSYTTIYSNEPEVADTLQALGWWRYRYQYSTCWLLQTKDEQYRKLLGRVSGDKKYIPEELLFADPDSRLALLQGLMDSDGTCGKDGSAQFITTNDNLRDGVVYLVRSLGGRSSWRKVYKESDRGGRGWYYKVRVSYGNKFRPFRLARKNKRLKTTQKVGNLAIKSIERITNSNGVCFAVDHPSKLFVVDGFVVTHNTVLGATFILTQALAYPDTAWLMGRKELVNLKRTTLITFYQICQDMGVEPDKDFTFNQQQNIITFANGSKIFLLDLSFQPSDPLYTRLGGLELTGAFVDQSEEVPPDAIDILKTRIGRKKNKDYGLIPKLFETFNPAKNHVYQRYYKPWREGKLPEHMAFIQALPTDNEHLPKEYIEQLRRSDKVTVMRLLHGNFEYDDDPSALCAYDDILDMFTNTVPASEQKFLSADIARFGSDKTVFAYWQGLKCYKIEEFRKMGVDETVAKLQAKLSEHQVPYSHCIVDSDGIGGGVFDFLKGIKGFVANAKPFHVKQADVSPYTSQRVKVLPPENYGSLKDQCGYTLADKIQRHEIRIEAEGKQRTELIEELEQLKVRNIDDEGKKRLAPKEDMKEVLRRSPDLLDTLIMRMWFELSAVKDSKGIRVNRPNYTALHYGQRRKNVVQFNVEKPI